MNIKPSTMTIAQLLSSRCQFTIPRFQREYSWDKKNYKEFLEDMIECLQIKDGEIKHSQYFLGTMLFIGTLEMPAQILDVVDGQQRLTIITILFSAIADHFLQIGNEVLQKKVFQYIMTEDDNGSPVRILKSKTHYPFFSYFIQDINKSVIMEANSEEEECIKETYDFLFSRTEEISLRKVLYARYGKETVDGVSYEEILKALRDQILQSTVVIITSGERKEANAIFAILNAKGKHLASIDLIKNQIFSICDTTEPADYAEIKWNSIRNTLFSGNETIGMGSFFRHYWISKYSASSEKKLYDKFIKIIRPANEDTYKRFLDDLDKNSKYYMRIINPSRNDYNNRKEYFWLVQSLDYLSNCFNIVQTRIALMAVFEKKEEELLSAKKMKELIQFLEGFHFAYNAMLSRRANVLDSIYANFARKLRVCKTKEECIDRVDELINRLDLQFPSFDEFKKRFIQLTYSKQESPDNIKTKYVINRMESFYSKDRHEVFDEKGSIEHILPEENGGEALNIGNLILLECKLNNDARAFDYNSKKSIYLKSQYPWVIDFVNNHENWTNDDIGHRAIEMADIFYHNILGRK